MESLLQGREHQLVFKNPADPLFYKCTPGGYGVDRTQPARANDLTGQVAHLAEKAGLSSPRKSGEGVLKKLRRWGGEDVKNQLGEKTAQQVLGHIEGGSVLHNNYARGVQTMDMAALRAPEAGEGDVQRAEEAIMRHISRSPAVRARAVRIADGKPVEGIDSVSFIQADSADTDEAPTVINTAKRTQVHTLETTKEINKAVLIDPDYVAAKDACSDAWNRFKSLTSLRITPDQKGSNLTKGGKPGSRWLEQEVDDEVLPEDSTELPEGWGTVAARKNASEEYTAAKDRLVKVRQRVRKHLSYSQDQGS